MNKTFNTIILVNLIFLSGCIEEGKSKIPPLFNLSSAIVIAEIHETEKEKPVIPKIHHGIPLNREVLSPFRLGALYFGTDIPEIYEFTDMDIFPVSAEIKGPEQESKDIVTIILDGKTGKLIFHKSTNQLGYIKHDDFLNARSIDVDSSGIIALITSGNNLNLCFYYSGGSVARKAGCNSGLSNITTATALGEGKFLVTGLGGIVGIIDSSGNYKTIKLGVMGVDDAAYYNNILAIVYAGNIHLFIREGDSFTPKGKTTQVRFKRSNPRKSNNIRINSIAFAKNGLYAVSKSHNCLLYLDEELNVLRLWRYSSMPIPFHRVQTPKSIVGYPDSSAYVYFTEKSLRTFYDTEDDKSPMMRRNPEGVMTLVKKLIDVNVAGKLKTNPSLDILSIPEVKESLENSISRLNGNN